MKHCGDYVPRNESLWGVKSSFERWLGEVDSLFVLKDTRHESLRVVYFLKDTHNVSLRGVKVPCNETLRGVLVPAMKHCREY